MKDARLEAKARILAEIKRLNEGWVPDCNVDDAKYFVGYNTIHNEFIAVGYKKTIVQEKEFYLKSPQAAMSLSETHGDDLMLCWGLTK
jgi:hypothetical protein